MFVELQHIGGAQKEDAREEVPLDFKPRVRRDVEQIAQPGVACAYQATHKDKDGGKPTEILVYPVDQTGQRQ